MAKHCKFFGDDGECDKFDRMFGEIMLSEESYFSINDFLRIAGGLSAVVMGDHYGLGEDGFSSKANPTVRSPFREKNETAEGILDFALLLLPNIGAKLIRSVIDDNEAVGKRSLKKLGKNFASLLVGVPLELMRVGIGIPLTSFAVAAVWLGMALFNVGKFAFEKGSELVTSCSGSNQLRA